jgi:DNA primase small subunit
MSEKDWKEADLIFDVDAKDLNLPCRNEHSCIKCLSCGEISIKQLTCPSCNSSKIDEKSLTCQNCISGTKNEVKKLTEILINDLGIDPKAIQVFFSGNEGFHISVINSVYQTLGSRERTELVDYIMFRGAMPETFGMKKSKPERSLFPDFNEMGWRGRISKHLFGSKSHRSKAITEITSQGYSVFQERLDKLKNTIGVKIDPNVTIDIHRIFRLAGTINSKSGLSKILCKDLDKFNPYIDACFVDEEKTEVIANCPVNFTLKNRKFGPYKNEKISLPRYAAIYLICKGLALVP